MLPASRIDRIGETPHAHERDALRVIEEVLTNSDPFHVWELFHLLDPGTGRLLEIDALIMGYSALYLVEIKSGPGLYEGNTVDWYRTPPEGGKRWMAPPLRLVDLKAKILKSRLQARMQHPERAPRIEPLVFLSAEQLELRFEQFGDLGVVTRKELARAAQFHQFRGAPPDWQARPIDKPLALDIARTLKDKLGIRPRKGKLLVGDWELGDVIEEGDAYQDRLAHHRDHETMKMRARVYLVPEQTSVERRQQLRRAADREAQLLFDVREHPNILQIANYATDAPLGPTVLFHHFEGEPLDTFLRRNPELPFFDRVEIIRQVGQALAYCHGRRIIHGALSPQAVLVRRDAGGALATKLLNFQLGRGENVSSTLHVTALAAEPWLVYQAPEVSEDPSQRGVESDLFSLGALTYFVLTGQPPAQNRIALLQRLERDGHLDPLAVNDGIPVDTVDGKSVLTLIEDATKTHPAYRGDDVAGWVELLYDVATAPQQPEPTPEIDPLQARRDDILPGELMVEAVLGQGATSRVLKVLRGSDNQRYALKCGLSEDQDPRLCEEAAVLRQLYQVDDESPARVRNIVRLVDQLKIAGRTCLLMSLAGQHTLYRELSTDGVVSLDYAMRYGDELLEALDSLEERGVVHRDIKPANIGVGTASKGKKHLTLFDFSLAGAAPSQLEVGTSAYRDPFLRHRGAWDSAADRWAAAVTMHEMLTGVRPGFSSDKTALDPDAEVEIAAERFDPSVRTRLSEFFKKALRRDAHQRFESASDMRRAWTVALGEKAEPTAPALVPKPAELGAISDETPVEALPLSPRARNALDRACVLTAAGLRGLPENQLSAVRGVGTGVAREILDFRRRWCEARNLGAVEEEPFCPGYRGDDVLVSTSNVSAPISLALEDAGLPTLGRIAGASAARVEAVAKKHGFDVLSLRRTLEEENRRAGKREYPTSVEAWMASLLPKKQDRAAYLELLYGLIAPFAGRMDVRAVEVSEHLQVTRARVYQVLADAREHWEKHGGMPELRRVVHGLLETAGGALPLTNMAEQLVQALSAEPGTARDIALAHGAGLAKIVADVEKTEPEGIRTERLHDQTLWLLLGEGLGAVLEKLGETADELARRPVLPSPGEVARALGDAVAGSSLERLEPARLVQIAAQASHTAASSPRLELYPRRMSAGRALELSATVLTSPITAQEVVQRVRARYPEAEPLEVGDALRAMLGAHGLEWNEHSETFERPGARGPGTLHTSFPGPVGHLATASTSQPRDMNPEAIAARELDEQLDHALDRRLVRVVGVSVDRAQETALALRTRKGMRVENLDARLLDVMGKLMREKRVSEVVVHATDREGPGSKGWRNLRKLAQQAAERVAAEILPARDPVLLVQLGLVARYELDDFMAKVVMAGQSDESHATFLLIPSRQQVGLPRINDHYPIPGILASQTLWISREWLENRHNAAA